MLAVIFAGAAVAQSAAGASPGAGVATVRLASTLAGRMVVNRAGYVLFTFSRDRRRRDSCVPIKSCLRDWPPVTTTGKPIAGPGLKRSLLGTIAFKGGLREVTYAGHPLHMYRFALSAGTSVISVGIRQFGGSWYALTATGTLVK